MKRLRAIIGAVVALFVVSGAALGTVSWMKTFKDLYKPKKTTAIYKAKCLVCHKSKTGKDGQNSYGKLLEKNKVEAKSLKAIERKDADKDRFTNISEIKAGTLPGDSKSKPRSK